MARARPPERVGEILDRLLRRSGWGRRVDEGQAMAVWGDVVGEPVRTHTRPLRVQGGQIVVAVRVPVWKQEVSLLREEIIEKLNQRMGGGTIRDIRLVVR